jgi:hypothetical protein
MKAKLDPRKVVFLAVVVDLTGSRAAGRRTTWVELWTEMSVRLRRIETGWGGLVANSRLKSSNAKDCFES